MRGQYAHNTGIWLNSSSPDGGLDGGWQDYVNHGYEQDNVATRLDAAGYRTALIGKYLNGYKDTTYVPRDGIIGSSLGGSTSTTTPTITVP
jgi:N-acetylglucosamine-6-sulfatase